MSLTDQRWTVCTGEWEASDDQGESTLQTEQAGQGWGKDQAVQECGDEEAALDGDKGGALLQASFLLPFLCCKTPHNWPCVWLLAHRYEGKACICVSDFKSGDTEIALLLDR